MNNTKIEWTDRSWNPVTGCKHGCPYCYAAAMSHRFGRSFEPSFHPDRLEQPLAEKRPQRIFCCSVSDLFGEWVDRAWIDAVMDIVRRCPQHIFQFLTKNPARLPSLNPWPCNCWVGASAINQAGWNMAARFLPDVEAPVRFISAEPLLTEISPAGWVPEWLIIGGQTGIHKFSPPDEWIELLGLFADEKGIPVFHKPNLGSAFCRREFPGVGPSCQLEIPTSER
jgi:protein gp37